MMRRTETRNPMPDTSVLVHAANNGLNNIHKSNGIRAQRSWIQHREVEL